MYSILPFLFLAYLINEYRCYSASKYLALGDSLAVGIGGSWGQGYTRLYYNWLTNSINYRYLSYCNLGVVKWTSKDLLNAVTYNTNYRNAISSASIITIDIGGNDILCHKYSPDKLYEALDCYRNNLCAILTEIRRLNNHAPVYLMDIYNPYPLEHEMHKMAEHWITAFNSVIWNTLGNQAYYVSGIANVYTAFKGNEYNYTLIRYNNVHPNTLGYKIINDCYKSITII